MTKIRAFLDSIKRDAKPFVADLATVGGSLTVILTTVENVAPAVHLGAGASAAIVTATTVISTLVAQARRFVGAQKAAAKS